MRQAKNTLRQQADVAAILRNDQRILNCVGGIAHDTERIVCIDERELFQTLIGSVRTMVII